MNRRHTRAETEAIIKRLRDTIPGLVLRTTFIVGFPGETEEEFEELLDYVAATKFERLGVFSYSFEPDTPAAKLPNQLPDDIKQRRRERIMAVQEPIAERFNQTLVNRTLDILIDAPAQGHKSLWLGRAYTDAPDVDGLTLVPATDLAPGDLVSCEIVEARGYDLVARPLTMSPRPRRSRPRPRPRRKPANSLTILDGMS
jgi:ribosomal protein S12 methylthiotransferase